MASHILELQIPAVWYEPGASPKRPEDILSDALDRLLIAGALAEDEGEETIACLITDAVAIIRAVEAALGDGEAIEIGEHAGDSYGSLHHVAQAIGINLERDSPLALSLRQAMARLLLGAPQLVAGDGRRGGGEIAADDAVDMEHEDKLEMLLRLLFEVGGRELVDAVRDAVRHGSEMDPWCILELIARQKRGEALESARSQ
ncbi:MAG: hypothetical protein NXI30_04735 [bacterium]|nr:hypothetical protein [bacterium]